jgi:hypothetical protein
MSAARTHVSSLICFKRNFLFEFNEVEVGTHHASLNQLQIQQHYLGSLA